MLLRKLTAAFCPLLVCAGVCMAFRWLDRWLGSGSFWAFAFKGLLLGAAVALALPSAGVRARTNGLTGWMFLGAGMLALVLVYQYLETQGMVHVPVLRAALLFNGQVVLVESAFVGYLTTCALLYRRR